MFSHAKGSQRAQRAHEQKGLTKGSKGSRFGFERTQKHGIAPIDEAVESDMFCMNCDAAIRLRQKLRWDPAKEKFTGPGAEEANKRHSRTMRAPWTLKEA